MFKVMYTYVDNRFKNQGRLADLSLQSPASAEIGSTSTRLMQVLSTLAPQLFKTFTQPENSLPALFYSLFCTLSTRPTNTTNI